MCGRQRKEMKTELDEIPCWVHVSETEEENASGGCRGGGEEDEKEGVRGTQALRW